MLNVGYSAISVRYIAEHLLTYVASEDLTSNRLSLSLNSLSSQSCLATSHPFSMSTQTRRNSLKRLRQMRSYVRLENAGREMTKD
jgi:hypothetical protein